MFILLSFLGEGSTLTQWFKQYEVKIFPNDKRVRDRSVYLRSFSSLSLYIFFISSLFLHEVCVFEKSNNLVSEPYLQSIKHHKNQTVDRFDMSSKEKYKSEEI